jgi:LEA14-like dessication related protein
MPKYLLLFLPFIILFSCKSQGEVAPVTVHETSFAALEFRNIEAHGINKISLHFLLRAENPYSQPVEFKISGWDLTINGEPEEAELAVEGSQAMGFAVTAGPNSKIEKNMILTVALDSMNILEDECDAVLRVTVLLRRGETERSETVSQTASFPKIHEPVFTITSITIIRSELINTRFRVGIKIENRNAFPLVISSFDYELHGEGRFWASGRERNILAVPERGSAETNFQFTMNFIDMSRGLLDDIIALRQVNYRFSGNVDVGTDFPWIPVFKTTFSVSGLSPVID